MQFILFTYGLSIAYLFISLMKYKYSEYLEQKTIAVDKTSIVLALIIKPIVFTSIAIGLNNFLGQQIGFWLVGIGHLMIVFYYSSHLYIYSKKQGSFLSEQT